jgi:hypothetical protein
MILLGTETTYKTKDLDKPEVRTFCFENLDSLLIFYNKENKALAPRAEEFHDAFTSLYEVISEEPAAGSDTVYLRVEVKTLITK